MSGRADGSGALELIGLRRSFGERAALDGLSFGVPAAQVFGFLVPDGAGKTTAMRAVVGVIALDGGEVRRRGALGRGAPGRGAPSAPSARPSRSTRREDCRGRLRDKTAVARAATAPA